MKKYVVIVLIVFHLINSSLHATNSFVKKDYVHQHHHSHSSSIHQHKHSHAQVSVNFVDFFTYTQDVDFFEHTKLKQIYLESLVSAPNHILESLFHPPKV